MFSMFLRYVVERKHAHAATLLQVPAFWMKIRHHPSAFLAVFASCLLNDAVDLGRGILKLPFFAALLNYATPATCDLLQSALLQ